MKPLAPPRLPPRSRPDAQSSQHGYPCWVAAQQGTAYGSARNDTHFLTETWFQSAHPISSVRFNSESYPKQMSLPAAGQIQRAAKHTVTGTWHRERARPRRTLSLRSMASQVQGRRFLQTACSPDAAHSFSLQNQQSLNSTCVD